MRDLLNQSVLASISRAESSGGFVSVYAGADRADPDRPRIELKNAFGRIETEHADDDSLEPLLAALGVARAGVEDAVRGGVGVAGFVPIGGLAQDAHWVGLPSEIAATVVVGARPYVLPLTTMVERFGVAGVVAIARDQIAIHQWAGGRLEEFSRRSVDVDTMTWRDTQGPFNAAAAGNPSGGSGGAQSAVGTADAYAEKLERATIAELAGIAAPLIGSHVDEGGWERLVWFGDRAIAGAVRELMGDRQIVHVSADDAQVLGLAGEALADRVREATQDRWTQDGEAAVHALAERHPAERAEGLDEASARAREGRVGELFVAVADPFAVDDDHVRVNALIDEVGRHGGQVRALPPVRDDDRARTSVAATLRW